MALYVPFNALLDHIGTETSEMADGSAFRQALAGCEPTLATGLRYRGKRPPRLSKVFEYEYERKK